MPNNHSLSAEHRRHDRLLVARFAAGDAAYGQEHEAQDLIRRCSECAALAADIGAISKSVARLPAPPRPRDFRLTTEQAAQLRGSRLDRWLRALTGSGWATVRPVAAVALSVGLVMSVVGFMPILGAATPAPLDTFSGPVSAAGQPTPASSPAERTNDLGPTATKGDAPAPTGELNVLPPGGAGSVASPASGNMDNAYIESSSSPPDAESNGRSGQPEKTALAGSSSSTRDLVLLSGLIVTILALAVLALLYAARRRYFDPLLR